jgi:hypothetical protein
MDPTLKFVIESACWTGLILLAGLSAFIVGKRLDWFVLLAHATLVVSFIVGFAIDSWGSSDTFPAVVGLSLFAATVIGTWLGGRGAWLLVHRRHHGRLNELAATDFGGMAVYFLTAVICLSAAVAGYLELRQGAQEAYERAPICEPSRQEPPPSASCRSQANGIVLRTWAEGSRQPRQIEVSTNGRTEVIQVSSNWNIWETLAQGQRVEIISWKGKVTAVTVPGVGVMETNDSPSLNGFVLRAVGIVALVAGLGFGFAGLVYAYKCWAATRGDDTRDIDLAA